MRLKSQASPVVRKTPKVITQSPVNIRPFQIFCTISFVEAIWPLYITCNRTIQPL